MGSAAIPVVCFIIAVLDVGFAWYCLQVAGIYAPSILAPVIDIVPFRYIARPAPKRRAMRKRFPWLVNATVYLPVAIAIYRSSPHHTMRVLIKNNFRNETVLNF